MALSARAVHEHHEALARQAFRPAALSKPAVLAGARDGEVVDLLLRAGHGAAVYAAWNAAEASPPTPPWSERAGGHREALRLAREAVRAGAQARTRVNSSHQHHGSRGKSSP